MSFMVAKPAPYNVVLRWSGLCAFDVMLSPKYLMVKFPTDHEIRKLKAAKP